MAIELIKSYKERWNRELHPCFGAKQNKGRIHLPVCAGCNIECNFCDRSFNSTENRPGVTAAIIKPEDALKLIEKAIGLCPDISVVGIAGPGDTLASDKAFDTFYLVNQYFPQLIKCMSTNGLMLNERANEVIEARINTLTVTVNAVDPKLQSKIISGIHYHGKRLEGEEAAAILIENQLEGIKKVTAAGITVKVNTVLINEINKEHIKEIAKVVSSCGAELYNIIPLIPRYKLQKNAVPGCHDVENARRNASEYIEVFRHCQRCRADAVGIPGRTEFRDQIYVNAPSIEDTFSHG